MDRVTAPTRVILADDDVLLREGVASLLERSGFDVVGQAGDGAELLALSRELVPELVLVDIRMPPDHSTEGLDAAKAIRLGADIVGQAAGVLPAALAGAEAVIAHFEDRMTELRIACFCTACRDLRDLRRAPLLN